MLKDGRTRGVLGVLKSLKIINKFPKFIIKPKKNFRQIKRRNIEFYEESPREKFSKNKEEGLLILYDKGVE